MCVYVFFFGLVEVYCIDECGEKCKVIDEFWLEIYFCSVL